MNSNEFAYWLQGFVEMNSGQEPNKWQWRMIKDHLQLCFVKVTKDYTSYPSIDETHTITVGKWCGGGRGSGGGGAC